MTGINKNEGKRTLICLFALFVQLSTVGVVKLHPKGLETVEVDLKNGVFKKNLPFDAIFNLKGRIDKNIVKVRISYEMVRKEKLITYKKRYKPDKQGQRVNLICDDFEDNVWCRSKIIGAEGIRKFGEEEDFTVRVGPLHPNKRYKFTFELYTSAVHLKKDVSDIIGKHLDFSGSKDFIKRIKDAQSKINVEINKLLTLKSEEGEVSVTKKFEVNFAEAPYVNTVRLFLRKYYLHKNRKKSLIAACDFINSTPIIKNLSDALQKRRDLSPPFDNWWEKPLNYKLDGLEKTKMSEVARMITDGEIKNVLKENARIKGNSIFPSKKLDINSIKLLLDFFYKMRSASFGFKITRENEGVKAFVGNEDLITNIIGALKRIIHYSEQLDEIPVKFEKLEDFNKTLSEALSSVYILGEVRSVAAIVSLSTESKGNPYLALDLGVGFVPALRSPFFYTGINYNFLPVNKKGLMRIFRAGGWLFKRSSLLIGLTSGMVDEGENRNLFKGGNVIIGLGFRISRSLKINWGGVIFKQVDENPLVDKERTNARQFLSISFDSDLEKLLGRLAKIF
jgi:hypothetical protein